MNNPELILIVCEGKTEAIYFSILKKRFRLPTYIKIIPDVNNDEYENFGQHEKLIDRARELADLYADEYSIPKQLVEAWAVCDRDEYTESFTKIDAYAKEKSIKLAFSDPQFENFLLQHFSQNKSASKKHQVERELTIQIIDRKPQYAPYRKNDLSWLDEMIDEKHSIVKFASKNASVFSKHTRQPFFTIQKLIDRLLGLVEL